MPVEVITHQGKEYPKFQSVGNAAKYCRSFAEEVCKGEGFDIGYSKEEWKFSGAIGIEPSINPMYHSMHLPDIKVDYIFSSHMLEHSDNWVDCLEYWADFIKPGGVLFLYLPDYSQTYWRCWFNRKHRHTFTPEIIRDYLVSTGKFKNIFVSGVDAYNSFTSFCEKKY